MEIKPPKGRFPRWGENVATIGRADETFSSIISYFLSYYSNTNPPKVKSWLVVFTKGEAKPWKTIKMWRPEELY